MAEVVSENGRWQFVNFHYGEGKDDNLVSTLKLLRDERQKSAH